MKKIVALAIALSMIISLSACSKIKNAGGDEVISPMPADGKVELTILVSSIDYNALFGNKHLDDYIAKFEKDFGVNIKFEQLKIDENAWDSNNEYLKKLFIKLITKDGPELILNNHMNIEPLIDQQAVVDLRGKVENVSKIYDGLLSDKVFYIPLGLQYVGMMINRATFDELNMNEPEMNWTTADYFTLREKWISKHKIPLTGYEYFRTFPQFIDIEDLYDAEVKKVTLNTPEVRKNINELRSYILGGIYQLNDGYKYENYYNMLYEYESKEAKEARSGVYKNGILDPGISNLFRAKNLNEYILEYAIIKDVMYNTKGEFLSSYGFLVNKNGKHKDLAYEFINGLLSNESQMSIFEYENNYYNYYPVNKEIEEDILMCEKEAKLDPRAIQIKANVLQELKDGKYSLSVTTKSDIYELESMIRKDLTKLILADDPYSDEQLQVELKRMEDKYNVYLNE